MKKWIGKRMIALAMACCMLMSLSPAVFAAPTTADVFGKGSMNIKFDEATSEFTCSAALTMGDFMADYVIQMKDKLEMDEIIYECIVTFNTLKLPATLDVDTEITFTDLGGVFEPIPGQSVSREDNNPKSGECSYTIKCRLTNSWKDDQSGLKGNLTKDKSCVAEVQLDSTELADLKADLKSKNNTLIMKGKVMVSEITMKSNYHPDFSAQNFKLETYYSDLAKGDRQRFIVDLGQASYAFAEPAGPGGPGGGGPVVSDKYNINIPASETGTVTSKPAKQAAEKETVTLTVTPNTGYRLESLEVVGKDGSAVAVTDNKDGTYTFTMPKQDVTVKAKFALVSVSPQESGVSKWLDADNHRYFMQGYPEGDFRPDGTITRAEVAQLFYNLLLNKNVPITASFDDVKQGDWYYDAVSTLASLGILTGYGDGTFLPNKTITRAEFSAVVARFADPITTTKTFVDVPQIHWAYGHINTAATYGWVDGVGDGKFAPESGMTRAQVATLVNRMLGRIPDIDALNAGEGRQFPDVTKDHWAWAQIGEATTTHNYTQSNGTETWKD